MCITSTSACHFFFLPKAVYNLTSLPEVRTEIWGCIHHLLFCFHSASFILLFVFQILKMYWSPCPFCSSAAPGVNSGVLTKREGLYCEYNRLCRKQTRKRATKSKLKSQLIANNLHSNLNAICFKLGFNFWQISKMSLLELFDNAKKKRQQKTWPRFCMGVLFSITVVC